MHGLHYFAKNCNYYRFRNRFLRCNVDVDFCTRFRAYVFLLVLARPGDRGDRGDRGHLGHLGDPGPGAGMVIFFFFFEEVGVVVLLRPAPGMYYPTPGCYPTAT